MVQSYSVPVGSHGELAEFHQNRDLMLMGNQCAIICHWRLLPHLGRTSCKMFKPCAKIIKSIYKAQNHVIRDYSRCISTHTYTHTHTRGTCTHKHTDYTKLNLHNLKWAAFRHETDEDSSMEWKTWQVNNLSFIGGCHHNLSVSAAKHCCWKVHVCSYKYTALCSNNFTVRSCQNQKQFCSSKNQLCSDKHTSCFCSCKTHSNFLLLLLCTELGSQGTLLVRW